MKFKEIINNLLGKEKTNDFDAAKAAEEAAEKLAKEEPVQENDFFDYGAPIDQDLKTEKSN